MTNKLLVVQLEGSGDVPAAGNDLEDAASEFGTQCSLEANQRHARTLLRIQSSAHPEEVARIETLMLTGRQMWQSDPPPDHVMAALSEMRRLLPTAGLNGGLIADLCRPLSSSDLVRSHTTLLSLTNRFINAARAELHPPDDAAAPDAS